MAKNTISREELEAVIDPENNYEYNEGEILNLIQTKRIDKDTKKAIQDIAIDRTQMRYLIDIFYQVQDSRIEAQNRIRAISQGKDSAPDRATTAILEWDLGNLMIREAELKKIIENAVRSCKIGQWLIAVNGIGPLIAGGLIAYLDIDKAKHATSFHQYAGLNDNNRPWLGAEKSKTIVNGIMGSRTEPTEDDLYMVYAQTGWPVDFLEQSLTFDADGKKRKWTKENLIKAVSLIPYNKRLKVLCYKIGEQFVKISNKKNSLYGRLYKERKALEIARNEAGKFADQAAAILKAKNFNKNTDAYKAYIEGKLPKAHIDNRAKRWAVKIFISHVFEEMYWEKNGCAPAPFYVLANTDIGEHTVMIDPEVPFTNTGEKFDNSMEIKVASEVDLNEMMHKVKVKKSDGNTEVTPE